MFEKILTRIGATLEAADLDYMVIGGQAVLLYGEPRLTKDIDVTLGVGPEQVAEVVDLVRQMNLKPLAEDPESFVRETMVLPCQASDTEVQVDLVFSFSPYEQQAFERTQSVEMSGTHVQFASPEDVIVHKIVAGRPRDLEDVRSILLKNPSVDQEYVRHWLTDFSASLGRPFLDQFENILREVDG
ncbi:MAG: hypothetical protein BRD45_04750 [Bacteroidetes bacterium QS_8_64_10]|jgi:predicted nucleotidyltransferase|nr:MAG: hypothetical protein BRD45_04750 [Bacteroidetes bacterium QS_8_64_10]